MVVKSSPIIMEDEKVDLNKQKRYHRRHTGSDTQIDRTIIQAQNELAFRKKQLHGTGTLKSGDPVVLAIREEIKQLRS